MSSPTVTTTPTPSGKGATFTYLLGVFAFFAVLLSLLQSWFGQRESIDPRADLRKTNTAEIQKAQDELTARMGLADKAKSAALYARTAGSLKAKTAGPSAVMVPGSPTQLKMAPPAAAPAASPAPAKK